jgi:hypothetical protein
VVTSGGTSISFFNLVGSLREDVAADAGCADDANKDDAEDNADEDDADEDVEDSGREDGGLILSAVEVEVVVVVVGSEI